MSWSFSQALVEEFWPTSYTGTESFAPSKSTPTVDLYLSTAKTTECSKLSRFGMMFELLAAGDGEELLKLFRADFPVKTSARQEMEQGCPVNNLHSGLRCFESYARWNPDTSSWKTSLPLFTEDLEPFSGDFPKVGIMRHGKLYRLETVEHHTCGSDSGYSEKKWRTPTASDATRGGVVTNATQSGSLTQQVNTLMRCPTPTVNGNNNRKGLSKNSGDGLATWVKNFTNLAPNGKDAQLDGEGMLNPNWVEWLMGFPIHWTQLFHYRNMDDATTLWYYNWKVCCERGKYWTRVLFLCPLTIERKNRVNRIKALGNAQVPICAYRAFSELMEVLQ